MGQIIGSVGDAEKTFTRGVLEASSCQVSPRWQGHQVKCTRLFWHLAPRFCWLCSSCGGILQTCLMGCQLSASPASPMFIPHANWCNLQQKLQSIHRAQYKNTSQELLMILKHPSFWKKLVWVYTVLNKTLNILPLGLLCQKQTQMWILWYISALLLIARILGSLSAAVTSRCLWEKCTCNKLGSHWSHRIISRVYIIIPSELFIQVSWTVPVHFTILILQM